jgi:hypothetical protein
MVRKKYQRRRTNHTWDELISCIVTGSPLFYQTHFTTIMLKLDHEQNGQIVMNAMKQLGNELYTASHLGRTNVESAHETSLVQFKKKQQDQWTQGMQCYWCWKLGHKSSDCSRRQAGQPKLPKPGSTKKIIMMVAERCKQVDVPDVRNITIQRTAIMTL